MSKKRESVCSLGQELTEGKWPIIHADLAVWIGHLGDTTTRWDNGVYVDCNLLDIHAAFLTDSGSTATLNSKKLIQSIVEEKRPRLIPMRD